MGSRLEVFYKESFLHSFAKLTGKHLCWSIFLIKLQASYNLIKKRFQQRWRRATSGMRWGGIRCPFMKIRKLILEHIWIVLVFGSHFSFKMMFSEYLREKTPIFFLAGLLSHVLRMKSFLKYIYSGKSSPAIENTWLHPWGVFPWVLGNFWENLFWRTSANGCLRESTKVSFPDCISNLFSSMVGESRRSVYEIRYCADEVLIFSLYLSRSSHRRWSKTVFLEISQNSQENTGARLSFLIKLQAF